MLQICFSQGKVKMGAALKPTCALYIDAKHTLKYFLVHACQLAENRSKLARAYPAAEYVPTAT
jgi:hypothetical protein